MRAKPRRSSTNESGPVCWSGRVDSPEAGGHRGGNNYKNHRDRHHQQRGGAGQPAPSHRVVTLQFSLLKFLIFLK